MNCVFEDDSLIERLLVQTDYLHRLTAVGHALAVIEITTRTDQLT